MVRKKEREEQAQGSKQMEGKEKKLMNKLQSLPRRSQSLDNAFSLIPLARDAHANFASFARARDELDRRV